MFIVTTATDAERAGCLVGFAAQCSIDPPRFMVWLSDKNRTTRVAERADTLVVHLPQRDDTELAELFGGETGDDVDKFARCRWHAGTNGVPVLDDCPNWFAGRILERIATGDHVGHLLEIVDASVGPWRGQYRFREATDIDAGHAP